MTKLAHNAAILGIPVDPVSLYHASDDCVAFVDIVVDDVLRTRDATVKGG